MPTVDCGDEAATWFSRYILDQPNGLRLGYLPNNPKRDLKNSYPDLINKFPYLDNNSGVNLLFQNSIDVLLKSFWFLQGLYTDLTSFMLMNKSSVDDLNTKLNDKVNHRYFRPNILVDGDNIPPFDEDNWEWIKIGHVVFRSVKPCTRCTLTTINPDDGVRNKQEEPLKTLKK